MADYTHLTNEEIAEVCRCYGLDYRRSLHIDGGMANSSYLVHCTQGDYVLTVLDNHDAASARRLVDLMGYLVSCGVPTSMPVADLHGEYLAMHGDHPIIIKHHLPGMCVRELPDSFLPAAGALLAAVNLLHPEPARFGLRRGRRLPADTAEMLEQFADQDFARWLNEQLQRAQLPSPDDNLASLVHGDVCSDNIVVGPGETLALLDWETAVIDLPVVDLGMAVFGLCRSDGQFRPDRAVALIEGYQRAHVLCAAEHELLLPATVYAALLIGYHRYVRHHIRYPAPARQHLYREIPPFVNSLVKQWPRVSY